MFELRHRRQTNAGIAGVLQRFLKHAVPAPSAAAGLVSGLPQGDDTPSPVDPHPNQQRALRLNPPKNFVDQPFAYHQEIELEVTALTHLGLGLGRLDGWVVMVPYALPGERVRARVWRNKKTYSEADLVALLQASPERVEPFCPLFGRCGGCQYQHLDAAAQLRWKQRHIEEHLQRLGGLEAEVEPCWPSPVQRGYRSKITPHYPVPRPGAPLPIGFQKSDSRATLDIPSCPIATEAINARLGPERARLQEAAEAGRLKKGGTLLLRDTGEAVVTDMRAVAEEAVGALRFRFIAGEFFQNNPYILPAFIAYAVEQAAATGLPCLADVYCGVGVFGIAAAERFREVIGIEVSERAAALARENADLNGADNVRIEAGTAEALFGVLDTPPSETVVLLDPPRKGCDAPFLEQLLAYGPARIVYVSCGPDTQARDLRVLVAAGYAIERVQPFDLFPQTRHIENVVTLQRAC